MKAVQIVAAQRIEIVETSPPQISEGMVLVKTAIASICGSDMPDFLGAREGGKYPIHPGLPGHETVGTVIESRSSDCKEGDRVLALPSSGGFAEYFLAHPQRLIKLPEDANWSHMVLAQPLSTVLKGAMKLGSIVGKDIVVLGQGPIGLLWTGVMSNSGARKITAIDLLDERLDVSKKLGATHVLNPKHDDLKSQVLDITEGKQADMVIEAVGHETTANQGFDFVKFGGIYMPFGVPEKSTYNFRFSELFRKQMTMLTTVSCEPKYHFPIAIDMILSGKIKADLLITHHFHFSQSQTAFEIATKRKAECLKVQLKF